MISTDLHTHEGKHARRWKGAFIGALAFLGVGAFVGKAVYEVSQYGISELIACYDMSPEPNAWMCKQVLAYKLQWTDNIAKLNQTSSALVPLMARNEAAGRELLQLFVDHGVDVNAVESGVQTGWTALHIMAMDELAWPVAALLEAGANPTARDSEGMTPLDRALQIQKEHPAPERAHIIALLDSFKKNPASKKSQSP